jgi:hypothetical protein
MDPEIPPLDAQRNTVIRNALIERRKSLAAQVKLTPFKAPVQKTIKEDLLAGKNDSFKILYQDTTGARRTFLFSLLPAIESGGSSGLARSMVPEVRAGISIVSAMKQKNIVVPGGVPVAQTIGVESTILQCVGAFIGTERANAQGEKAGDLSTLYLGYTGAQTGDSESKAKEFMTKVVRSGRPVTFELETSYKTKTDSKGDVLGTQNSKLVYRGLVISFKYHAQRSNRTYYALSLLITDY